jgi:hypothetical protein
MTAKRQSLSFPHPFCQKALPHLANRAELTKIKDPPNIVNPKSGSRYRGSEVGFTDMTSHDFAPAEPTNTLKLIAQSNTVNLLKTQHLQPGI